jgi:hypothetical protein
LCQQSEFCLPIVREAVPKRPRSTNFFLKRRDSGDEAFFCGVSERNLHVGRKFSDTPQDKKRTRKRNYREYMNNTMKVTSGILKQISDKKTRNTDSPVWIKLKDRIDKLIVSIDIVNKDDIRSSPGALELCKYYPVALVACIEDYTRATISHLIDYGSPYIDRISEFKEIEFKTESILGLHKRTYSLGEIISHLLPASSYENVIKHFKVILSESFFDKLKDKLTEIDNNKTFKTSQKPGDVFGAVKEAFRLRHIFAHEFSGTEQITVANSIQLISRCYTFLYTLEMLINTDKSSILLK